MNPEVQPYVILGALIVGVAYLRGWISLPAFLSKSPAPAAEPKPAVAPKEFVLPDIHKECIEALAFLAENAGLLTSNQVGVLLSVVARYEAQRKIDTEHADQAAKAAVELHAAPFAGAADPSQPAS